MDRVNDDHTPVIIRRSKNRSAILMRLEDFHSYEEASYLLSTPANARALPTGEAEHGDIVQRNLVE